MIRRVIGSLVVLTLLASGSWSEIIYSNPADTHVIGSWEFADGDSVLVKPTELAIDLNHDGTPDASIAHHYTRGINRIPRESVELLQAANLGQREIFSLLKEIRLITLDAANEGVNDADKLQRLQAQADSKLDRINRIAGSTKYGDQKLLDGSAGMTGTASNPFVTVLNVAETAQPGFYAFTADTSGARATYITASPLGNPLSQDETLTVNGVIIELHADMTTRQLNDRINEFTLQTGVTSHVGMGGVDAGKLRLSSLAFGQTSGFDLISNVDGATPNATGIGTTLTTVEGVDLVVTFDDIQFNGKGNTVTADSGPARGVTVSVAPADHGDHHYHTAAGSLGVIHVSDQSLSFPLNPSQDETADISIRTLHSGSLGISVVGNQFANLSEINLTSASQAQDAIAIVDSAVDTVEAQIQNVDSMLDDFFLPFGEAFVEGVGFSEIAIVDDEVSLLTTGEPIGPDSRFSDETLPIGSLEFDGRDSAFLGVRLLADDQFHYGWIRAEIAEDESLFVRDYAFESVPNRHIRAGFVPEPSGRLSALIGLCLGLLHRRRVG